MLSGGQFSKSRRHAVWLPSFLERFDPDTLRYYLAINMPENHDTDFNWPDFVEKINNELIAAYGNFVHRVLTLGTRFPNDRSISTFENLDLCTDEMKKLEEIHSQVTSSLERHRFKEALRGIMSAAQFGNQMLQAATPWKHLKDFDGEGAEVDNCGVCDNDATNDCDISGINDDGTCYNVGWTDPCPGDEQPYGCCPWPWVKDCRCNNTCVYAYWIGDGYCNDPEVGDFDNDLTCYGSDGGDCPE